MLSAAGTFSITDTFFLEERAAKVTEVITKRMARVVVNLVKNVPARLPKVVSVIPPKAPPRPPPLADCIRTIRINRMLAIIWIPKIRLNIFYSPFSIG
jgi:hypothetical protein